LNDILARMARDAGCKFFINTDAHHPEALATMRLGLAMARRAGLTTTDVLNTKHLAALKTWIATKRRRG
jgi:DNA polymerase (family X)